MGYWSTTSPTSPRTAYLGFANPLPVNYWMWQSPSTVTVANTNVETAILTGAISEGSLQIPANYLQPGTMLSIHLEGLIGCAATPPTFRVRILFGGVVIFDTTATTISTAQFTSSDFESTYYLGCSAIGTTGTMTGAGIWWVNNVAAPGLSAGTLQSGTINTTIANNLSVAVTWGTSDPANTITLTHAIVEIAG
jgi:hypothetical protein